MKRRRPLLTGAEEATKVRCAKLVYSVNNACHMASPVLADDIAEAIMDPDSEFWPKENDDE